MPAHLNLLYYAAWLMQIKLYSYIAFRHRKICKSDELSTIKVHIKYKKLYTNRAKTAHKMNID